MSMEKLIVTATVDSRVSYPNNPYCPPYEEIDRISDEYARCVEAGAAVVHMHGVRTLEKEIQPDGRRVSKIDFDGWKRMREQILEKSPRRPIIQFGVASARIEEKVRLMTLGPDMMSVAFNSHDEHFQPDPAFPANEMYAVHPRTELEAYAKAATEHGVKLELECFQPGAYYNVRHVDRQGFLPHPMYITIFVGWPGGTWLPSTPDALDFMVRHLPENAVWNVSCMDPPNAWQVLSLAIATGGHVRVGWEDNPYLAPGRLAESCHMLVEKIVRMATDLGREIATPDEARAIIWGRQEPAR